FHGAIGEPTRKAVFLQRHVTHETQSLDDPAPRDDRRSRSAEILLGAREGLDADVLQGSVFCRNFEAGNRCAEALLKISPAKLAVRDHGKPDCFLLADDGADGLVLCALELAF